MWHWTYWSAKALHQVELCTSMSESHDIHTQDLFQKLRILRDIMPTAMTAFQTLHFLKSIGQKFANCVNVLRIPLTFPVILAFQSWRTQELINSMYSGSISFIWVTQHDRISHSVAILKCDHTTVHFLKVIIFFGFTWKWWNETTSNIAAGCS